MGQTPVVVRCAMSVALTLALGVQLNDKDRGAGVFFFLTTYCRI